MLYDHTIFQYLISRGFGETLILLIIFGPMAIVLHPYVLWRKKKISDKKLVTWSSLYVALYEIWIVTFIGFYWWIALLSAPIAFVFCKIQVEMMLSFSKRSEDNHR